MRRLSFGRLSSAVGAGVQVLSNLVGRLVIPAGARSWPYGSWFPPGPNDPETGQPWADPVVDPATGVTTLVPNGLGVDPDTGLPNNQMGIQTAGFGLGVWARGWKNPAGLRQKNLRGTAGNPTVATLASDGDGNQVTVGFASVAQWHLGVGRASRSVSSTVAGVGPIQTTFDDDDLKPAAPGDAFYAPISIPMISVADFGTDVTSSIQNGNGSREVRVTGGSW